MEQLAARRLLPAFLASAALVGACSSGDVQNASVESTASAEPTVVASATPSVTEPASSPTRAPKSEDVDRFVSAAGAEVDTQAIAMDIAAAEGDEIVVARISSGTVEISVAAWDGVDYVTVSDDAGGRAAALGEVRIEDLNGDGQTDIAAFAVGSGIQASVAMWTVTADGRLEPLTATGGCHDGSHVYGVVGAELQDADEDGIFELSATCDDSPLPVDAWHADLYVWDGSSYTVA